MGKILDTRDFIYIFSLALLIFDSLILLIKTLIGIVRSCFVGFLTRLNIYLLIYDLVEKI